MRGRREGGGAGRARRQVIRVRTSVTPLQRPAVNAGHLLESAACRMAKSETMRDEGCRQSVKKGALPPPPTYHTILGGAPTPAVQQ